MLIDSLSFIMYLYSKRKNSIIYQEPTNYLCVYLEINKI